MLISVLAIYKEIIILVLAILIDWIFGDPPNRFHPVCLMGFVIRRLERFVTRGTQTNQLIGGIFLVVGGGMLFAVPLYFLEIWLVNWPLIYILVNAILLKSIFSFRGLIDAGTKVRRALLDHNLEEARKLVAFHLVSRRVEDLDEAHVVSATVESIAENLVDGFLSPLLAFVVGGIPLAWAYRYVNTADAMIGYHDEIHEYSGKATARLDDAFNCIPARLGGVLLALAAPVVKGSFMATIRLMMAQNGRTESPNAGWPMAAAAGALKIQLEKKDHYLLGETNAFLPVTEDIRRATRLTVGASLLGVLLFMLILWSFINAG